MKQAFDLNDTRYTPEPLTYNGVSGNLWERRQFQGAAWVLDGKLFQPERATHAQVVEAFDEFDNTGCN